MYADSRTLRFADGPDEVHRNQIGRLELREHLVGLAVQLEGREVEPAQQDLQRRRDVTHRDAEIARAVAVDLHFELRLVEQQVRADVHETGKCARLPHDLVGVGGEASDLGSLDHERDRCAAEVPAEGRRARDEGLDARHVPMTGSRNVGVPVEPVEGPLALLRQRNQQLALRRREACRSKRNDRGMRVPVDDPRVQVVDPDQARQLRDLLERGRVPDRRGQGLSGRPDPPSPEFVHDLDPEGLDLLLR